MPETVQVVRQFVTASALLGDLWHAVSKEYTKTVNTGSVSLVAKTKKYKLEGLEALLA